MNEPQHEHCRSCNAAVIWATHVLTRRAAPLDATPVPDGNCVYYPLDGTYRVIRKGEQLAPDPGSRHTNHFQTCPQRATWRKKEGVPM